MGSTPLINHGLLIRGWHYMQLPHSSCIHLAVLQYIISSFLDFQCNYMQLPHSSLAKPTFCVSEEISSIHQPTVVWFLCTPQGCLSKKEVYTTSLSNVYMYYIIHIYIIYIYMGMYIYNSIDVYRYYLSIYLSIDLSIYLSI